MKDSIAARQDFKSLAVLLLFGLFFSLLCAGFSDGVSNLFYWGFLVSGLAMFLTFVFKAFVYFTHFEQS